MTDKWQLYSQAGVDGPEYGIRIRPGYVVVGFQKEDAKEIIGLRDEVELLRSALAHELDLRNRHIESLEARIKELEADRIEARAQYLLFMNDNPGCIAWNFDELDETEQDALREQARYMLELEEPWAYIQLREAREQIKRLAAAFMRSNAAMRYYQEGNRAPWPQIGEQFKEPYIQKAREALERIKADEKL